MSQPYVGEIRIFAGNFAPAGWALCNGATMPISENETLFNLIGTTYGGDGQETFNLPDLQGRFPVHQGTLAGQSFIEGEEAGTESVTLTTQQIPSHTHPAACNDPGTNSGNSATPGDHLWANQAATGVYTDDFDQNRPQVNMNPGAVSNVGGSQPHDNMTPYLVLTPIISLFGIFPTQSGGNSSDSFMGELRIFSFNFAPGGWAQANGQLLPINQNQALFSLFGTSYGGNGQTNFAIPNLQGRIPIHVGGQFNVQGESGGEINHTLTISELPTHNHFPMGNNGTATVSDPTNSFWSNGGDNVYSSSAPNTLMRAGLIGNIGGSQAHNNMSPYLVLNICVALQGIFPSRN